MDTGLSLEGFTYPQTSIQLAIAHQRFAALAMVRELFGEMMKMNRELLFRGFRPCDGPEAIVVDGEKVKGRWVEGYIVKHPSAIQIGNDYSPWYIHVSPADPDDNGGVFNVLPSTIGQYTGLTDKNGKRIFEGDRVKGFNDLHQREEEYIVMWACNNGFYFVDDSETEWHPEHVIPCEIIGTVFDEEATNET